MVKRNGWTVPMVDVDATARTTYTANHLAIDVAMDAEAQARYLAIYGVEWIPLMVRMAEQEEIDALEAEVEVVFARCFSWSDEKQEVWDVQGKTGVL